MELQNLNENHWRDVFRRYDTNGNGKISFGELKALIQSREYKSDIPGHVVKAIFNQADTNGDGELDLDEFVRMVHNPKNEYFFSHLLERYKNYVKLVVPKKRPPPDATEIDGVYEDQYSCWPPAVIMVLMSLVEIVLYVIDYVLDKENVDDVTGPIANRLLYDPRRRVQVWRFLTYMFVHIGPFHLIVNILVQIMLGTPLEMVHRGHRVIAIYLAGVLAGSLGTSITDPNVKLAGASGGVYSLMTAHVATIILNWSEMSYPIIQLFIFVILVVSDVGTAIYDRYYLQLDQQIGYAAHFFGALAGFLVGITVLRNIEVKRGERILRWIAVVLYVLLMGTAIVWNAAYTDYFPVQVD